MVTIGAASDVPRLERIESLGMDNPWTSQCLTEEIDHPGSHLLVARLKQSLKLVGYLAVRRLDGEAEILRLVVDPQHRKLGIASQLLATAFDRLVANRINSCFLEVREDNHPALRLYRRFSFSIVHRRPNYYRDGCEALVLAADTTRYSRSEPS